MDNLFVILFAIMAFCTMWAIDKKLPKYLGKLWYKEVSKNKAVWGLSSQNPLVNKK